MTHTNGLGFFFNLILLGWQHAGLGANPTRSDGHRDDALHVGRLWLTAESRSLRAMIGSDITFKNSARAIPRDSVSSQSRRHCDTQAHGTWIEFSERWAEYCCAQAPSRPIAGTGQTAVSLPLSIHLKPEHLEDRRWDVPVRRSFAHRRPSTGD